MKIIKCELCGNNDLVKQDEMFVCQYCGTKYTPEEAKKLMINFEHPIEVKGISSVDEKLKNIDYLIKINKISDAERLLEQLSIEAPQNPNVWLAYANISYAKCMNELETKHHKRVYIHHIDAKNVYLENLNFNEDFVRISTYGIIKKHIDEVEQYLDYAKKSSEDFSDEALFEKIIESLNNEIKKREKKEYLIVEKLCTTYSFNFGANCLSWFENKTKYTIHVSHSFLKHIEFQCETDNSKNEILPQEYIDALPDLLDFMRRLDETRKVFDKYSGVQWGQNRKRRKIIKYFCDDSVYKKLAEENTKLCKEINKNTPDKYKDYIGLNIEYAIGTKICIDGKQYSTKFEIKDNLQKLIDEAQELELESCYVATCVYNSYNCPQVWTLRRFRDYKLSENWFGKWFISLYYTISPTIVKWFGHSWWFQSLFRCILDKIVANLKEKGYSDTPYNDKY